MSDRPADARLEDMMNNNTDPAVAAARLGDELSRIAGQMSAVSADFAALADTLAANAAVARPTQPQPQPQPLPRLQYATVAPGHAAGHIPPQTPHPYPQTPSPYAPSPYAPNRAPHPLWTPRTKVSRPIGERLAEAVEHGLVGRVLAAVGVGITLIGVVLLLILAAQAGLLRPEARVAGGALFAIALVGIGARIGRRAEKRSGALALVATGTAAALFDVLAASSIYHWLPETAALILGGVIGAGGLWLAHRWESHTLGLMVSIPLLVFAPIAAGGVDALLVAFMLVYAACTLWIQADRDWTALFLVNTAAATLPTMVFAASSTAAWFVVIAVLVNIGLALVSAIVLIPSSSRPIALGLAAAAAGAPTLMLGDAGLAHPTAIATTAFAAALFVLAAFATRGLRTVALGCRSVWLSVGAVLATISLGIGLHGDAITLGLLAASIITAAGVRWADDLADTLRTVSAAFAGFGLVTLLPISGPGLLAATSATSTANATAVIGAVLGLVATTLLAASAGRRFLQRTVQIWLVGGVVDLWLVTSLCVSTAGLVTGGSVGGFRAGHLAATLLWFASGAAALLWARRQAGTARTLSLTTGLAVVAAAVAKLCLFDLATLAGAYRVVAFIVAGLVLLSLGVAYAQSLTAKPHPAATPTP